MLTEEQKIVHKEFRKYLRLNEGQKGNMLNTIINAVESNLPALIRQHIRPDFQCLYDNHSIEDLLKISLKIKSDDKILAGPFGYISSKSIDSYIKFYASKNNIDIRPIEETIKSRSEIDLVETDSNIEGRISESIVLRRQRNRKARQQCIENSGCRCYVCGFDFERAYGEIGKGFIEVHHKKPLAEYEEEHEIPQSELCALCSNCHSMVHRTNPPMDVEELKSIVSNE